MPPVARPPISAKSAVVPVPLVPAVEGFPVVLLFPPPPPVATQSVDPNEDVPPVPPLVSLPPPVPAAPTVTLYVVPTVKPVNHLIAIPPHPPPAPSTPWPLFLPDAPPPPPTQVTFIFEVGTVNEPLEEKY